MKAVIYARQSSGDEEESASIENQLEKCREYAKKNDIEVVAEYADENTSGRTYPLGSEAFAEHDREFQKYCREKIRRVNKRYRKGLAKVLEHFGNINYVIVYDDTRLMRPLTNSYLQSYIAQLFMQNKVEVITLASGIINYNNFTQTLVTSVTNQVNDNAVKLANQKSIEALKILKNEGYLTNCVKCLGLESAGKQKLKQTDDADLVKLIYQKYLGGESIGKIVQYLNNNDPKKRKWVHIYVLRALKRMIYTGYTYDETGNLIKFKPMDKIEIISLSDYSKAQEKLSKNPGAGKSYDSRRVHPLSGILHCGSCKGIMETRGTVAEMTYYNCKYNSAVKRGKKNSCTYSFVMETCEKGKIPCHDFYAYPLKESLKPLLYKALIDKRNDDRKTDNTIIEKDGFQKKLESIGKKEEDYLRFNNAGDLSPSQFVTAMKLLEAEKKELKEKISILNEKINKTVSFHVYQKHQDMVDGITFNSKPLSDIDYRLLAARTFKRIYIYKYHIHIIFQNETNLTLERICYSTGRHFPKIEIHMDVEGTSLYNFYVCQKSYLKYFTAQHRKGDISLVKEYPEQKNVYSHDGINIILVGENDIYERYCKEGLTYLDNLPLS